MGVHGTVSRLMIMTMKISVIYLMKLVISLIMWSIWVEKFSSTALKGKVGVQQSSLLI